MINIIPSEIPSSKLHEYLLGCVAPRPIAFVSTIDKEGNVNLAPFSFFNVFGSNPPTLIFSPSRSGRTGKTKHTLDNLYEVGECVVNIVSYDMIHQCNLASAEFEKGVNEFERAGFTQVPSSVVKPPRVGESKAHIECKVKQIIETGQGGGAGNLVICEVVALHVSESVLDGNGGISPFKFDQVARLGKNYWARIVEEAIIEMPKMPDATKVLGVNNLPDKIRLSSYLTGNEIALLANNLEIPTQEELDATKQSPEVQKAIEENNLHQLIRKTITSNDLEFALKLALLAN
jgi:flavin reductase (DIM6/NTAB) family NADH-FMN oxidoreductase RutF